MSKARWAVIALVAPALAASCTPPKEEVKQVILRLQSALEQKDASTFARYISYDYEGVFYKGRADLVGSVQEFSRHWDTIQVVLNRLDTTLGPRSKSATAVLDVHVKLTAAAKDIAKEYDLLITLGFAKEREGWRVAWSHSEQKRLAGTNVE